jgi:hypothetical protein
LVIYVILAAYFFNFTAKIVTRSDVSFQSIELQDYFDSDDELSFEEIPRLAIGLYNYKTKESLNDP